MRAEKLDRGKGFRVVDLKIDTVEVKSCFDSVSSHKLGVGFIPITLCVKPAETCHLVFHVLTLRKIVICALVSSFVAVSGCFRFPSPTPMLQSFSSRCALFALRLPLIGE